MYRALMEYPPAGHMLAVMIESQDEKTADQYGETLAGVLKDAIIKGLHTDTVRLTGPVDATVKKINDIYRKLIFLKSENQAALEALKDRAEEFRESNKDKKIRLTFDMDPMNGY